LLAARLWRRGGRNQEDDGGTARLVSSLDCWLRACGVAAAEIKQMMVERLQ